MTKWINKGKITGTQIELLAAIQAWVNEQPEYKRLTSVEMGDDLCKAKAVILTADDRMIEIEIENYDRVRPAGRMSTRAGWPADDFNYVGSRHHY